MTRKWMGPWINAEGDVRWTFAPLPGYRPLSPSDLSGVKIVPVRDPATERVS